MWVISPGIWNCLVACARRVYVLHGWMRLRALTCLSFIMALRRWLCTSWHESLNPRLDSSPSVRWLISLLRYKRYFFSFVKVIIDAQLGSTVRQKVNTGCGSKRSLPLWRILGNIFQVLVPWLNVVALVCIFCCVHGQCMAPPGRHFQLSKSLFFSPWMDSLFLSMPSVCMYARMH